MSAAASASPHDLTRPARLDAGYETDFYGWSLHQAELIRAGRWAEVDLEHIAQEIEGLGRSELSKLVSFYRLILLHQLKWEHQPNFRSGSWAISIAIHRAHAADVLSDNPSLKARLGEACAKAYRGARLDAAKETGLPLNVFPDACPFTWDEMTSAPYAYE